MRGPEQSADRGFESPREREKTAEFREQIDLDISKTDSAFFMPRVRIMINMADGDFEVSVSSFLFVIRNVFL